jgi:hypothetical protein
MGPIQLPPKHNKVLQQVVTTQYTALHTFKALDSPPPPFLPQPVHFILTTKPGTIPKAHGQLHNSP